MLVCPEIMLTKSGNILSKVKSKPCSIMEKLSGKTVGITNVSLCKSIGTIIGNFHTIGSKYSYKISNSRDIKWVEKNIANIKNHISREQLDILNYCSKVYRKIFEMKLPNGMIHSDLFRDNVLAKGDNVTGIIDYYYSFNGPLIYELAVIINDWCVNKDGSVNSMKYNNLLNSYDSVRKLTAVENKQMNNAMIAAGLRFYLSRLVDMIFPKVGEITHIKDPSVFETIVKKRINLA
jgi:homoserine kinase type II